MVNSKKKIRKENQSQESHFARIKAGWQQKRPILFFVLGFAALMILFYVGWQSAYFDKNIQPRIVSLNGKLSSFILNLFGLHTQSSGDMIYSSKFSISIKRGCDAVEAIALFSMALLAFPAEWKNKIIGLFVGIFLLFILNLVRIVSLFLTGIYYPKAFELMHVEVWQVLFILAAVGLWIFFIQKATKAKMHAA